MKGECRPAGLASKEIPGIKNNEIT